MDKLEIPILGEHYDPYIINSEIIYRINELQEIIEDHQKAMDVITEAIELLHKLVKRNSGLGI